MPSRFYKNVIALSKTPADFTRQASQVIEISGTETTDDSTETTVVDDTTTTVVTALATTVIAGLPQDSGARLKASLKGPLWQAETNGSIFPSSRVKRVEKAQDALTHAEECVYDCLWGVKNASRDESRLARVGYDRVAKTARITKRNAALIIERLIEKGFITIHSPADPLQRIPTQYRVLSYKSALESLARRNRRWVVRSGNGVLFVHPMQIAPSSTTVVVDNLTTVVDGTTTTVVAEQPTTVVTATTLTVVADQPTTVVAATTLLDNKEKTERQKTSSALASTCRRAGLILDAAAERTIQKRCYSYDKEATDDEMAYFADIKIHQLHGTRNIGNLIGLLITAVPEYFVPPAHELWHYRAGKIREQAEKEAFARKILEDKESTSEEREWAQSVVATV